MTENHKHNYFHELKCGMHLRWIILLPESVDFVRWQAFAWHYSMLMDALAHCPNCCSQQILYHFFAQIWAFPVAAAAAIDPFAEVVLRRRWTNAIEVTVVAAAVVVAVDGAERRYSVIVGLAVMIGLWQFVMYSARRLVCKRSSILARLVDI